MDILTAEFTKSPATVAGRELRPFTFGSLLICRQLGLTLITGEAGDEEIPEEEKQSQLLAFVYIQTAPVPEVIRAAGAGPERFRSETLLPWSMNLPLTAIPEAAVALRQIIDAAQAAVVEVLPRSGDNEGDAPPNF